MTFKILSNTEVERRKVNLLGEKNRNEAFLIPRIKFFTYWNLTGKPNWFVLKVDIADELPTL